MVGDKKYLKRNILYLYDENWILKPKNDDRLQSNSGHTAAQLLHHFIQMAK